MVYPQTLDAGNLKAKYDVLLFPDGGIPERERRWRAVAVFGGGQPNAGDIPAEFRGRLGQRHASSRRCRS